MSPKMMEPPSSLNLQYVTPEAKAPEDEYSEILDGLDNSQMSEDEAEPDEASPEQSPYSDEEQFLPTVEEEPADTSPEMSDFQMPDDKTYEADQDGMASQPADTSPEMSDFETKNHEADQDGMASQPADTSPEMSDFETADNKNHEADQDDMASQPADTSPEMSDFETADNKNPEADQDDMASQPADTSPEMSDFETADNKNDEAYQDDMASQPADTSPDMYNFETTDNKNHEADQDGMTSQPADTIPEMSNFQTSDNESLEADQMSADQHEEFEDKTSQDGKRILPGSPDQPTPPEGFEEEPTKPENQKSPEPTLTEALLEEGSQGAPNSSPVPSAESDENKPSEPKRMPLGQPEEPLIHVDPSVDEILSDEEDEMFEEMLKWSKKKEAIDQIKDEIPEHERQEEEASINDFFSKRYSN
jgi:hypothetical protein